jgi:cytochrome P450
MIDYDPFDKAVKDDPHRWFDRLRAQCPVHHHRLEGVDLDRINANPLVARPTDEFWSVFGYDDCAAILQDPGRFSSKEGPGPERLMAMNDKGMLIYADDPAHMLQRRIANKAFTPRMVEALKAQIQAIADDLVDSIADAGEADVMADFSVPLTIRVITRILGEGEDRVADFWRWGNATIAGFGGDQAALEASFVAMMELFEFLMGIIGRRRQMLADGLEPPDDVLTALIRADFEGATFTDDEILMACHQLLTAGFETTSTATGNAVYRLCTNPEQRAKLEGDWSLLDTAVEEILRYDAPIEGLFRTTTEPVEIGGCPIPAGAKVRVMYASANHDEAHFTDASEFRIDRDPQEVRKHLAFGHGPHACIGASLARSEIRIGLRTLLGRLPGLRLDPTSPPVRNTSLFITGFSSVPVVWDQIRTA